MNNDFIYSDSGVKLQMKQHSFNTSERVGEAYWCVSTCLGVAVHAGKIAATSGFSARQDRGRAEGGQKQVEAGRGRAEAGLKQERGKAEGG